MNTIIAESESKSNPQLSCLGRPPPAIERLAQNVFQDQVVSRPDAPAICSWDGYFTYKTLDQLSSRLAARMASFGVGPDVIVPILCEKSTTAVVCMLAVCKAGGAFAALDTSHPDERLAEIIRDTKATLLLTSSSQSHRFSEFPCLSAMEVSIEIVSSLPPIPEPLAPHPKASSSDLMYTIFTSGSTGRPKGVMIEHSAFVTSAMAYGADQGINEKSRVLQFSSYAFDMSIMEIFTTLLFGGCLCVPTDEERFGGVPDFVNKTGVNTLMLTPSYARLLNPVSMPSVRTLITGGEAVPGDLLEVWSPHVEVYIAYGPTEAAIQAAGVRLGVGALTPTSGLIGHPVGCAIWVVEEDNYDKLVPVGETGELLIEGHTLARGYLGDEPKTKEAFVDVVIGSESRRVYKTGDLVRQGSDGALIFVGRKDTQVKVQGIRFELTEIETRLSESHALSLDSKFCVDKVEVASLPNQATLATFISPTVKVSGSDEPQISWDQVEEILKSVPETRDRLSKILPAPLIPFLYIPVTFIPLASSAKTDRKALRQLVNSLNVDEVHRLQGSDSPQDTVRELSSSEVTMRQLWALVLNREAETIGLDDNFIHLGGDSVTSIRLVSAARDRGVGLSSSMILSNPVLSDLAEKALFNDASSKEDKIEPFGLLDDPREQLCPMAAAICKVSPEEIEDVLPMTINQMRWYGKTLVKPDAWLDQHHFRLPPDLDLARFQAALNSTVERAELLRARVIPNPSKKLLQAIFKFRPAEVAIVNDSLEAYLKQDLENPMGIGSPLSRYAIVGGAESSEKIFVWTIHHAIYDGYSISMLLHTISEFYQGLKPTPLTPFNRYLRGPSENELANGQEFWRKYLDNSSWTKFPTLPPAEKKLAPSMQQFLKTITIPSRQPPSDAVASTAPITTANIVRVAYATALSSQSSESASVLFLETLGGRNSSLAGIDRVAGPTLLTCPTRLYLSSSKTCREVLVAAQESLVSRMKFEDFPLMRILPLAPALELRNLLMIEDAAFLLTRDDDKLFGNGTSELNLDESDAMPMLFRCNIRDNEMDVDIRFDEHVIQGEEIETFVKVFERFLEKLVQGDLDRSFSEISSA
ncbi:hypothetical protein B0T10DRAFT_506885 [Thelonectria olida]|uniref:Carrier domain-containing protein n=1 Tax=Thelonectria olida TaxID=1576542 RepID=A0A9P8WFG1_9HYPO|nr:hypothetical protein B0T10DRAFT_506885 [Thelonectria olida]